MLTLFCVYMTSSSYPCKGAGVMGKEAFTECPLYARLCWAAICMSLMRQMLIANLIANPILQMGKMRLSNLPNIASKW